MPSARELLQQADALMRRNRARAVDTEIPELTEIVAEVAPASSVVAVALDDVPELVDAVEEIEIASIVELPEDIDEASGWLRDDQADRSVVGREADAIVARLATASAPASTGSHLSIVGSAAAADRTSVAARLVRSIGTEPPAAESAPPHAEPVPTVAESAPPQDEPMPSVAESAPPQAEPLPSAAESVPPQAEPLPPAAESAPAGPDVASSAEAIVAQALAALPAPDAPGPADAMAAPEPPAALRVESVEPVEPAPSPAASPPPIADDWARWEALAEEIRMQVLQRIDIFTDTRLRKQLSAQLQPIVDRASVQMVETINAEVGKLLRAYIAEAIEREIDKWRGTPR